MKFLSIQNGDYIINLNFVSYVDCSDPQSWQVWLTNHSSPFTLEGEDIEFFKAAIED